MLSALALLVMVAGWLLLRLTRCSVDRWRGVRASRHTQKKLMCAPAEPVWPVQPSSARACVVAADDLDIRSEHHAHLKKGHRRCHSAPVRVSPSSLATLAHSKGEAVGAMVGPVGAMAEAGRPTCDTRRVTTRALRRARERPPCAQQRPTLPSPSPQQPGVLERLAAALLRWAGPLYVLVLTLVLVPTAVQLRRVLQQEEIIDTDIASFRSITGQYTDRQDAFWLLLLESNASLLDGLAHASSAACIGVRGEACRAGWARVTHAVGSAPLWQPPCGDECGDACDGCAACDPLSYETLPCMQHWEAQPSCALPPHPHPPPPHPTLSPPPHPPLTPTPTLMRPPSLLGSRPTNLRCPCRASQVRFPVRCHVRVRCDLAGVRGLGVRRQGAVRAHGRLRALRADGRHAGRGAALGPGGLRPARRGAE